MNLVTLNHECAKLLWSRHSRHDIDSYDAWPIRAVSLQLHLFGETGRRAHGLAKPNESAAM